MCETKNCLRSHLWRLDNGIISCALSSSFPIRDLLFPWQLACSSLLNQNPTDSSIQTGMPDRPTVSVCWSLCPSFSLMHPLFFFFSSRSVYWLDKLPPEKTGSTTRIGTFLTRSHSFFFFVNLFTNPTFWSCSYLFFFLELTSRWLELCRSKKLSTQVT